MPVAVARERREDAALNLGAHAFDQARCPFLERGDMQVDGPGEGRRHLARAEVEVRVGGVGSEPASAVVGILVGGPRPGRLLAQQVHAVRALVEPRAVLGGARLGRCRQDRRASHALGTGDRGLTIVLAVAVPVRAGKLRKQSLRPGSAEFQVCGGADVLELLGGHCVPGHAIGGWGHVSAGHVGAGCVGAGRFRGAVGHRALWPISTACIAFLSSAASSAL